tara:strand:- start:615 stop:941 length:327 start_codon:yes stop_codon:yes gene_type:complete
MSRVSIARRLQAILEAAERVDPQAARVHRMTPALRARYEVWQQQCAAITDAAGGPEAAFAAYLECAEWGAPSPPADVTQALGLEAVPVLTDDMSDTKIADLWRVMCED